MALLERDRALLAMAASLSRARDGQGAVVFLVAEPGLGKTALLSQACSQAAGFTIGRASCSELEESVPFGLLDRLLGRFSVPGSELRPELAGSAEARVRRYAGILEWLRGPVPSPLLLTVDDLHWGDADSVELLSLLCRRLGDMAVAVLATTRPWPSGALDQARALVHDGFAHLERLRPLSGAASAALLEQHLGTGLPAAFVEAATTACAGNPFLLCEVAEAHARGEELLTGSATSLAEHIFLPRFAGVGTSAMRWAQAASALGTRFRTALVEKISDQAPVEAAQAFSVLCAAGLVRATTNGEAEFVHALFRQALYEDLSPPLRQGLHARALAALVSMGAPPAEAAPHALAAGLRGDPDAIEVLIAAGRQALAAGAVANAAEHFQRALELAGPGAGPGLLLEAAEVYLVTGKVFLAQECVSNVLALSGLAEETRVRGLALQGRLLTVSNRYAEGKSSYWAASELAARSDPEVAAAILLDGVYMAGVLEGPRAAMESVLRAEQIVENLASGNTELRSAARNARGYLASQMGDPSLLAEVSAHVKLSLAHQRRGSTWAWDVRFGYAGMARVTERFDESLAITSALMEEAERQGAVLTAQTIAVSHADTLWRTGQLLGSRDSLLRAAELADLFPSVWPFLSVGIANAYHEMGEQTESARWAERVETVVAGGTESPYLRLWICLLACRKFVHIGSPAKAVQAAEQAAAVVRESAMTEPCMVPWHGAAIEAYIAAGELERATAIVAWLEEICRPLPCQAPRAVAAWGGAMVAWRRGQPDTAEEGFQKALAHNAAVPMPLAEAETLIAYGRFLRHTGRPTRARAVLHQALTVLEATGAGRLQAIAREELAGAGGRRARAGPADRLTEKETQVADLAAKGLTNTEIAGALFISPRTVGHHLSSVYRKLGTTSRHQLPARFDA